MAAKISSIFNFEPLRYLLYLRNASMFRLAAGCLALALLFYYGLDALGLIPLLLAFIILAATVYRFARPHHIYVTTFLLSLILFFLAGECYLRIDNFGRAGLSLQRYKPADYGNPFAGFAYATSTYTGLAPNTSLWFKGAPFSINAQGFRGSDFPRSQADRNDFRFAVVGASASMGAGVSDDNLFTARIQETLRTSLPRKSATHVMNFGISGANWGNMLHVLEHQTLQFQPDLILFHVHHTLATSLHEVPRRASAYEGPTLMLYLSSRYRFLRNHSFLSRLLWMSRKGNLLHQQIAQRHTQDEPQAWLETRQQAFSSLLQRLQSIAPDTPIGLFILRPMSAAPESPLAQQYRAFVRAYAAEHGLFLIDGYEREHPVSDVASMVLYPGDHHPNHRGHAFHAQTLAPALMAVLQENCSIQDDS